MGTWTGRIWTWAVALVGLGLLFAFTAYLDLFEFLVDLSRRYEAWNLGSALAVALLVLPVTPVLLFDARRHIRETRAEAQAALEAAGDRLMRDPETGLWTRGRLNTCLDAALQSSAPAPTLVLVDLDRFRLINEGEGHDVGDLLLRRFARNLQARAVSGSLAFRLGGNEFALFFEGRLDAEAVAHLSADLQKSAEMPVEIRGRSIRVSCSLGVAHGTGQDTPITLMRKADQALASAKQAGGGACVTFDPRLDRAIALRAQLEAGLSRAVENGEIVPHFQPIVDLASGRIRGAEVLARWNHPSLGWIPPTDFVPLAEDMGLIGPLSWGLFKRSLDTATSWPRAPILSINLSPLMFREAGLVDRFAEILSRTPVAADRLQIEVTESAVITDTGGAHSILSEFRELGVGLALDDFGTGYSSLTTLSALPFTQLKIDQSFVMGLEADPRKATIAASVAGLAQGLGLTVTAEGIETAEERDFIAGLGCDYGQGYLFSRPVSAGEFAALLARDTCYGPPYAADQYDEKGILARDG